MSRFICRTLVLAALLATASLPAGCRPREEEPPRVLDPFLDGGLQIGDPLPAVTAYDEQGRPVRLAELRGQYTVLIFACLTCQPVYRNVPPLEAVFRDYAPKGVQFFYVYKRLEHPALNGYMPPATLAERLAHVRHAKELFGTQIPWLADSLDNKVKTAFNAQSNSEYIFDPQGKLVSKQPWNDPEALRARLIKLVGPVERRTYVQDLGMQLPQPDPPPATGIVPGITTPFGVKPLRVEAIPPADEEPLYVKLWVEADPNVLERQGPGKIYLSFNLDRLYKMHWNNQVDPPRFELAAPEGSIVSPTTGTGPKLRTSQDRDPREFAIEVQNAPSDKPLLVTFHYFACDDAGTFCKPVTQRYRVWFEEALDVGFRMGTDANSYYYQNSFQTNPGL